MRKFVSKSLAVLLYVVILFPVASPAQRVWSGAPDLKQSLDRLRVLGSVLMIGAHPDDENTATLAYFARGRHLETAYLSATRGEGGQNLIGSEQGALLGVIRTQELLAARRIDGAQQFFTRAIDFGFSKTAAETLEKWGHDAILSDMVWVIRRYQPDVVILRFSGTPRDGHGQHQASAILGKEAYEAAGDPARFPEQLSTVKVWHARRLVWNSFAFTKEQQQEAAKAPHRISVDAGAYNPVLGLSYTEIAGISRSQHRSQGMGAPQNRGPSLDYFQPVSGEIAEHDLFDGIDTTWNRLPGGARIGQLLDRADAEFQLDAPEKILPLLAEARRLMAPASDNLWVQRKMSELDEAMVECAGLFLDATVDRYRAAPGTKVTVQVTALNRSSAAVKVSGVKLLGAGADRALDLCAPGTALANNKPAAKSIELALPSDLPESQPFWLVQAPEHNRYVIPDRNLIGRPDTLPVMRVVFDIEVDGTPLSITRPVLHRYVDRVRGELTRPFEVVPPVTAELPVRSEVLPAQATRPVEVTLHANQENLRGELRLTAGPGWSVTPPTLPFSLPKNGDALELTFGVTPTGASPPTMLHAAAMVGGREVSSSMRSLEYEHIPPQVVFSPSSSDLKLAPLSVLARHVGYVMGAGDEEPAAIRQMGCDVTLLAADDLANGDLSHYDAIVTGVRAYNLRNDLRANQDRLLQYVKEGGTLIVQYNVAEDPRFRRGAPVTLDHLGPYPFSVNRDRVTVEEAPVEFLSATNPLLSKPNPITAKDFEGWVQERGLYFADKWDPRYQTVIESHDPGEKPKPGGMLYTRYGKGVYVFTAYAWFRQLPAGVPGAYRLFANLLSAGKTQ